MNLENKKQIAILLMAVALGLVAAVFATNYVERTIQEEAKSREEAFKQKYVAKVQQDMDTLREEIKRLEEQQKTLALKGPSVSGKEAEAQQRRTESKSSLALRTPGGRRAYTVMIDSLSAVGGMVNPGDFVDIIAHMNLADFVKGGTEKVSSVVFQNIQILAVGVNLQAPNDGYERQQQARALTLTFALTPEEASLMSFLQQHGQMQLLLRAPDETEVEVLETASWGGLADYMFEKQGTELQIPRTRAVIETIKTQEQEEVKPFIQIFQGGQLQ
ncbi:MAG: Flp pilus assembly protein CpaB [Candidatus Omnitrophota bacterium]